MFTFTVLLLGWQLYTDVTQTDEAKMKKLIMCAGLLLLPMLCNAQEQRPDDYVEYRQAAFNAMGWHFKKMGAMIQGRIPYDAAEFKRRATAVSVLSTLPGEGFIPETKNTELPTRLKLEMWYQKERFEKYMQNLIKATAELAEQAGVEDKNDLRSAYGKTARQCKSCHERFRESS
jgi:cytochrome c556